MCSAQGCSEQADTNPRTGSRWNRSVCWRCHSAKKAATERERAFKRKRDSLMAVSAPNEPDDLDDLPTQEWSEVEEVDEVEKGEGEEGEEAEGEDAGEREVGVSSPTSTIATQLAQVEAQAGELRAALAQERLRKEQASILAAQTRPQPPQDPIIAERAHALAAIPLCATCDQPDLDVADAQTVAILSGPGCRHTKCFDSGCESAFLCRFHG